MTKALNHSFKLARAFYILAKTGAGMPSLLSDALPLPLKLILPKRHRKNKKTPAPLALAFSKLGPTYIKLGQFLAVRSDILDKEYVEDLSQLHDSVPPFPQKIAEKIIADNFTDNPFTFFSEPMAAASIAQIHKAKLKNGTIVAVKIIRPNIEKKFNQDMASLFWAAQKIERRFPETQRLRPVQALKNLESITRREMDLRLEAFSMSVMAKNSKNLKNIYIPKPFWHLTTQKVLTMEWVEGIAINKIDELKAAGYDLKQLATTLLQSFLTSALYDGFFHADFHPGNLFVRKDGVIVPVDFGIMGNLPEKDRHTMAWILHAFIKGDYMLAAEQHIDAGYVPSKTDKALFAQALGAIGEPILDKSASDISMAELLWQLFETAGKFEMEIQPQLLLLQKTMLATEGLARALNPSLNIWEIATPIIQEWMKQEYAPDKMAAKFFKIGRRVWHKMPDILENITNPETVKTPQPPKTKNPHFLWALLLGVALGLIAAVLLTKFYTNFPFFYVK